MVYNSIDINKTNNDLPPSLTEHKKATTYDVRCTISSRPTRLVGFFSWCLLTETTVCG